MASIVRVFQVSPLEVLQLEFVAEIFLLFPTSLPLNHVPHVRFSAMGRYNPLYMIYHDIMTCTDMHRPQKTP